MYCRLKSAPNGMRVGFFCIAFKSMVRITQAVWRRGPYTQESRTDTPSTLCWVAYAVISCSPAALVAPYTEVGCNAMFSGTGPAGVGPQAVTEEQKTTRRIRWSLAISKMLAVPTKLF